jgi:hypothetical protein
MKPHLQKLKSQYQFEEYSVSESLASTPLQFISKDIN